jgi:hypothetical protein
MEGFNMRTFLLILYNNLRANTCNNADSCFMQCGNIYQFLCSNSSANDLKEFNVNLALLKLKTPKLSKLYIQRRIMCLFL